MLQMLWVLLLRVEDDVTSNPETSDGIEVELWDGEYERESALGYT
jgi:hypothetical protein